jgi:selenophosphate synthetase-related protein
MATIVRRDGAKLVVNMVGYLHTHLHPWAIGPHAVLVDPADLVGMS